MEHLSLHRVEEGFNEGVVGDLAWAVHALREAQLGKALLEGTSGILGAPIGVEYQAATGLTAAAAQRLVNPRTAIDATALGVNRPDLACQRFVLALTLATLARAPSIKASPRYPVDPAHQREIMLCPVYFDEGEDLRFRSEA